MRISLSSTGLHVRPAAPPVSNLRLAKVSHWLAVARIFVLSGVRSADEAHPQRLSNNRPPVGQYDDISGAMTFAGF